MHLSEADTKAKLIDPALHQRGWTEDLIRREETECGIDIIDDKPRRSERGRTDYLLRVRININTQPVAIALIEAKRSDEPHDKGLEQAKKYARLNHVPFVYSSNGHLFVEYDHIAGKTSKPQSLEFFPTPFDLRQRYEKGIGVSLESERAMPLLVPYSGGEASRRYYQDAAIRAALEKIARDEKKVLLFLATGSGKTFIAVHILKKIADTGQPLMVAEARKRYEAPSFEALIQLPDRVKAWCRDLFEMFLQTGGPHQETVIFCVRDTHADAVAAEINNLYADWCVKNRQDRVSSLQYKHSDWLRKLPGKTKDTLLALSKQFEKGGTEEFENPYVFNAPNVVKAGGLEALKMLGEPKDIINEAKKRLFAV